MNSIRVIVRVLSKALIGLSVAFVLLLGVLFVGMVGYEYFTRMPFNSSDWKTGGKWGLDKDDVRSRMVADLINRHQLKGMHRNELIELLGKPDNVDFSGWHMGWVTGMYLDDSLYFVVRFSSQGRVVEYDTDV